MLARGLLYIQSLKYSHEGSGFGFVWGVYGTKRAAENVARVIGRTRRWSRVEKNVDGLRAYDNC